MFQVKRFSVKRKIHYADLGYFFNYNITFFKVYCIGYTHLIQIKIIKGQKLHKFNLCKKKKTFFSGIRCIIVYLDRLHTINNLYILNFLKSSCTFYLL